MEPQHWWWVPALVSSWVLGYWAYRKSITPPKENGMKTVPVTGIMRPLNMLFNLVRGTTGISMFKIKQEAFIQHARSIAAATDTDLFGSQEEFIEALTRFVQAPNQADMSGSGIVLFNIFVSRTLEVRQAAVQYIQEHREAVEQAPLVRPIIISGLPRTGSTMLYNLLACDPAARAPRFFEISHMAVPVPPTASREARESDKRIAKVMGHFDKTERLYPGMWTEAGKSHRSHPDEIEEDLLTLFHSFVMQLHVSLAEGAGYREWYEREDNKREAYIYHRLFYQMMNQAWAPESHWVLKAPVHSTFMDALLEQYPDARVIITHRDPTSVVPSWARLLESYINWYYLPGVCDRTKYGRYILDSLVLCAKRMMDWRARADPEQYLDVVYSEMVKDPIAMVEKIYAHFDLPMTEEFRECMRQWIAENRQGKWGRRQYSLDDYGLTKEQLNEELAFYTDAIFDPAP